MSGRDERGKAGAVLAPGTRLGAYEVVGLLGAGGMGEVYRARDTRLGREVALKVLPARLAESPARLARLQREARLLAALNHPHIATLFGFEESGETPALVMELVEGATLAARLERGPLPLEEALELARQIAEALEAAHEKGILHRDLKPANVRLTEKGQVKLLDFGLAKALRPVEEEQASHPPSTLTTEESPVSPGTGVAGTAPYMSPEQARGEEVDRRSDLWAFGCVLYEMVTGRRAFPGRSFAEATAAVLDQEPNWGALPVGTPPGLARLLERCLRKGREERLRDAGDARLELEDLLGRRGNRGRKEVEERSPYPGLNAFAEEDAGVFFGREREVGELWGKLRERRLVAVIGLSGAGKTSFLRAGVIPGRPRGWGAVYATPGASPALGLARALTPGLAGDAEAMGDLLSGVEELSRTGEAERLVSAAKRWRARHAETLLAVDQFEELFTLNPPDTQERFATLLGRLASEADIHVVLSLRDDFLMRCHEQEALGPVFSAIAPLGALSRDGLRRALVEPASRHGYGFEDEGLVDEMLGAVEGTRGALPLVAFAASRLWERRDRDRKLLTREAYEGTGGVAGALAQHAEATLEGIGPERQGLVREIFRNLLTAHGTRAVMEREELLSAFPERRAAEEVLRHLVDARLLTSYGMEGSEAEPSHHRVEVVHESLLRAWPRLVRWQAQDEEGAVLRDQLKQAAHLWEEKGRTADLLWTGTAYREFELWRERYPGALTVLEEDFARSMADKAQRRKRLIRAVATTSFMAVTAVAVAIGVSRQQAARARDQARAEALRAEAGKLLALGRAEIDRYPTAALAYARKSLELADTPEARRFAVEALWRGPVARILPVDRIGRELDPRDQPPWYGALLSPDTRWLAMRSSTTRRVLLFPKDGGAPRIVPGSPGDDVRVLGFGPRSDIFVDGGPGQGLRFWSLPDLREIRSEDLGGVRSWGFVAGRRLFTLTWAAPRDPYARARSWPLPRGEPEGLGRIDWGGVADYGTDPEGRWLAYGRGRVVYLRGLDGPDSWPERIVGTHPDEVLGVSPLGADRIVSVDESGDLRIWSSEPGPKPPLRVLRAPKNMEFLLAADVAGTRLARAGVSGSVHLWDLRDPRDAEPVVLERPEDMYTLTGSFDTSGQWLVSSNQYTVAFWPASSPWKRVLPGYSSGWGVAFSPDSRWLVSCPTGAAARVWPLRPADGPARSLLPPEPCFGVAIHPAGTHVLVGTTEGKVLLHPIGEGQPRELHTGWEGTVGTPGVAFDAQGRRAAACPYTAGGGLRDPNARVLRVWDLESGRGRTFSLAHLTGAAWEGCDSVRFAPDGSLYLAAQGGVTRLVLPRDPSGAASAETVYAAAGTGLDLSRDGGLLLVLATQDADAYRYEDLLLFDLAARTSRRITTHGERLKAAALDPSGRILVTGDPDGTVRVSSVAGEEPHLLLGHSSLVGSVAISSDGRWIASQSDDALHLWPMPDVSKPPLHTLPHAELLARLDSLTNLRVVPDPASPTGWKREVGPFPGWKDVPTW
jgi:WD40 repeat protein